MSSRHLTVVVTGGAIDKGYEYNSSGLIRDGLPKQIHRTEKQTIDILKYPHGTICSYESERAIWPVLWSGRKDVFDSSAPPNELIQIDLMVHMGMRGKTSKNAFAFEKQARRDVYTRPGDDGKYLPAGDADEGGIWEGVPQVLKTGFDVDAARARVAAALPNVELEVSENAGGYFCEFELFSSLAECFKRKEPARVVFLHTPQGDTPEAIAQGVKVAQEFICALLDQ